MLALEQVSINNNLKGKNNAEMLLGKRSNNNKDNTSVVKTVTMVNINQKHIFELFCRIQILLRIQSLNQLEPKK